MSLRFVYFLFVIFNVLDLHGQASITFYNDILDDAFKIAKREKKHVFIDTYAPWCIPCKRMEMVFREPEVASYFNANFVNVRINMQSDLGRELNKRYDVIFLPTFIIFDDKKNVKFKSDGEMSGDELMRIANNALYPSNIRAPQNKPQVSIVQSKTEFIDATPVEPPLPAPNTNDATGSEKILYVLDGKDNQSPEYLYQEAYFRFQLMDGSHRKTAQKYLKTQKDWGNDRNMRFIFDFVYDTDSPEFQYLIVNRHKFESLLSKESVQANIEILVYNKLYQGFPRPNLKEAQALLSYVNPTNSRLTAHQYFLNRLYEEQEFDQYLKLSESYLRNINNQDDAVWYRIGHIIAEHLNDKKLIDKGISAVLQAVSINDTIYDYYDLLAFLYYKKGKKNEALQAAQQAIKVASVSGRDASSTRELVSMIQNL